MSSRAITCWVMLLSVIFLAACSQKDKEGSTAGDNTVPDKVLGLEYYRAHPDVMQATIAWCRGNAPDRRSSAQNINCQDASFAKMAPKPSDPPVERQSFRGGSL